MARTSAAAAPRSGAATAVREDEAGERPCPTSSDTSASSVGGAGPVPRERGQPLRPRIQARPRASPRRPRCTPASVVGSSTIASDEHDPRRTGREREADRVRRLDAAGELQRDRDRGRDRADRLEIRRRCRAARRRSRRDG